MSAYHHPKSAKELEISDLRHLQIDNSVHNKTLKPALSKWLEPLTAVQKQEVLRGIFFGSRRGRD